jgi:predicted DNA-binding helix-hairpin-helix protein
MGVVLKRARYFIMCNGKMMQKTEYIPELLEYRLSENKVLEGFEQIGLFEPRVQITSPANSISHIPQ